MSGSGWVLVPDWIAGQCGTEIDSGILSCLVVRPVSSFFDTGHILYRVLRVRDPIFQRIYRPCNDQPSHTGGKSAVPGDLWLDTVGESGEPRPAQMRSRTEELSLSAWTEEAQCSL